MPPMSKPTTCFDGDAAKALALVDALRERGAPVLAVKVGEVSIELAHVVGTQRAGGVNVQPPVQKSPMEEWGGPEFVKAWDGDNGGDLVDDDEQPAVRS